MGAIRRFAPCPDCCLPCSRCPPDNGTPDEVDVYFAENALGLWDGHYLCAKKSECVWEYLDEDPAACAIKRIRAMLIKDPYTSPNPDYPTSGYRLAWQTDVWLAGFDEELSPAAFSDYLGDYDDDTGIFQLTSDWPAVIPTCSAGDYAKLNLFTPTSGFYGWIGRVASIDTTARTITMDQSSLCGDFASAHPPASPPYTYHDGLKVGSVFQTKFQSYPGFYWGQAANKAHCLYFQLAQSAIAGTGLDCPVGAQYIQSVSYA